MTPGDRALIGPADREQGGGHGSAPSLRAALVRSGSTSGHRRQRTRYGATRATGGTSAHGARRTVCARCPRRPETVAAYIAECAGHLKVGSIQRRLNAIAEAHKAVGLESPTHQRRSSPTP